MMITFYMILDFLDFISTKNELLLLNFISNDSFYQDSINWYLEGKCSDPNTSPYVELYSCG
jgi:hypothetical protein